MPIIPHPCNLQSLRDTAKGHLKDNWHSVQLDLQTITPVYGGGTVAGEPDLLLPFRPRAIKNGLRHWWWLLNRHKDEYRTNSEKLYKDMCDIWGGASDSDAEASRAKVRVRVSAEPLTLANQVQSTLYEGNLGYILWMTLQAELAGIGAGLIKPGYRFSLQIEIDKSLNANLPHLNSVINAWLHLGGIGARTTRGLGKVKINTIRDAMGIDIKKFFNKEDDWFASIKTAFIQTQTRDNQPKNNALDALAFSVDAFKTFRQARQRGEIPSGRVLRINRSYWPKADVIRHVTKKYPLYHAPHSGIKDGQQPTPELLFGAPIVYKFKSSHDPAPGMLNFAYKGKPFERFNSPLLLTVVRVNENDFVPIACVLKFWTDVCDKQVFIDIDKDRPIQPIEPGVWWPNIGLPEKKELAKQLLSGAVMHEAKLFKDEKEDDLRIALQESAKNSVTPLVAFLNFFTKWNPKIK